MMIDQERLWNFRAGLGVRSGTRDLIAVELERRAIERHIQDGMRVLDVGCGDGSAAIRMARGHTIEIVGIDSAREMVATANRNLFVESDTFPKRRVQFHVCDVLDFNRELGLDLVYTIRCLINLGDWSRQQAAIRRMLSWLRPGGTLLMVECSQDGLDSINELRHKVGLPAITPPSHNRYLAENEMTDLARTLFWTGPLNDPIQSSQAVCSTYALLSRVVNAKLAMDADTEPDYDSPINRLALDLPNMGDLGQNRLWRWIKADQPPDQDRRTVQPNPLAPGDLD